MNTVKKVWNWFDSKSPITALIVLILFSSIAFSSRNFFSFTSLMNIGKKAASDGGFLALGMTFVILIGQIDLSVGAVLALSGVVMGMLAGINPFLGIIAGLGIGLLCGLLNGFMVAKMRISSWIASLAMMLGVRGIVLLITSQKPVSISNNVIKKLANTNIFRINILFILLVVFTLICMYVAKYTKFGMAMYAVGGNEEAARMMGLKVDRIKIAAYTCCGLFAAVAGILLAAKLYTAQPNAGNSWETNAIAMCALGGVKLSGGQGKFSGTFFGVLLLSVISTIFNYAGNLNSWWQNVVMGVLLLISIGIQSDVLKVRRGKKADTQAA